MKNDFRYGQIFVIIRKDMMLTDWEGIWMEKWFVAMKKADFNGIAEKYQISPIHCTTDEKP